MKRVLEAYAVSLAAVLICLSLLAFPGLAPGATTNNVSWSGGAGAGNPYWNVDANWHGGEAPANPMGATVTFTTNNQSLASTLDADRSIGTLASGMTESTGNRDTVLDLDGRTLTVTKKIGGISGKTSYRNTFIVTNGTMQVGTSTQIVNLSVGASATLVIVPGVTFNPVNLGTVTIGISGYLGDYLDMRGVIVAGGDLRMEGLSMPMGSYRVGQFWVNSATVMDSFTVTGSCSIGSGSFSANSLRVFVGDPDDTFSFEGYSLGQFPAGVDLNFGSSPENRGLLRIIYKTSIDPRGYNVGGLKVAGGGGACTAYLSSLTLAYSAASNSTDWAILDLSAMDSCEMDIQSLDIATGPAVPGANDNGRGVLRLPPGVCVIGDALIGAPVGIGYALFETSNTTVTITNSISVRALGAVTNRIGASFCGLDIANADENALQISEGGNITLIFCEPFSGLPHYGLRWKGQHQETLLAMISDGRIVVDNSILGKDAKVYFTLGYTFIGYKKTGMVLSIM